MALGQVLLLCLSSRLPSGLPFRVGYRYRFGWVAWSLLRQRGVWDWGRWLAGLANAPRHLLTTVAYEEFGYNKKPPSPLRLDGL